ncbi:hypothetical protein pb186bvf_010238 [Paramecium bursaria]
MKYNRSVSPFQSPNSNNLSFTPQRDFGSFNKVQSPYFNLTQQIQTDRPRRSIHVALPPQQVKSAIRSTTPIRSRDRDVIIELIKENSMLEDQLDAIENEIYKCQQQLKIRPQHTYTINQIQRKGF